MYLYENRFVNCSLCRVSNLTSVFVFVYADIIDKKMLDCVEILVIIYQWLQILRLYEEYCQRKQIVRRWFVKPHLMNLVRDFYGAYETVFLYYANNDEEEFLKLPE